MIEAFLTCSAVNWRDNNLVARGDQNHKKVGSEESTTVDSLLANLVVYDAFADVKKLGSTRLIPIGRLEGIDQHLPLEKADGAGQ